MNANPVPLRHHSARLLRACALALGVGLLLLGALTSAQAAVTEWWVKRYNGPANNNDVASVVRVDASGNVVVTGSSHNGSNPDYYTAKYALGDGALLWEKRYNGPANSGDTASALALDSSGNVVVTGSSTNSSGNSDYYTAKYAAANGALLWEKRYNAPVNGNDFANAVAVDALGNVVVTGRSQSGIYPYGPDYYTAKYAAANGALVWEQRYNRGGLSLESIARAVAVDSIGNVVVTGASASPPGPYGEIDSYTAKYAAADGALLWEQRYGIFMQFVYLDYSSSRVAVDGSDNVFVNGSATLKYLADGTAVWTNRFIGGAAFAVDTSGNVAVVSARSIGPPNYYLDYYTANIAAADGTLLWEQSYDGPANGSDDPSSLALGPNGMVAVTGTSSGDYATIVYRDSREPRILIQPSDRVVEIGSDALFTVEAANAAGLPMSYQWFFNQTTPVGTSSPMLLLPSVSPAQLGGYSVVVDNGFNFVTSRVALLLTSAPLILTQPADVTVKPAFDALFTVVATNAPNLPMSYQWFFNQTTPVGGDSPTLLVSSAGDAQAGGYSVIVNNEFGSVTSRVATLNLLYPPVVVTHPENQAIIAGDNVTFTVTVTNNATLPITYSWRKSANVLTNIELNSRTCSFTLFNVAANSTSTSGPGNYRVVTANEANTTGLASRFASLTVLPATAPVATTLAASDTGPAGATLNATVNPMGAQTTGWFDYGLTPEYGSRTSPVPIGNASDSIAFSQLAAGLLANMEYHYRVVATNHGGMVLGADVVFQTTTVAAPLAIGANELLPNGHFHLQFTATAGSPYTVLVSIDLLDWTPLGPATETAPGHFEFTDTDAPVHAARFYKLRAP